jgi:hypothetical protein
MDCKTARFLFDYPGPRAHELDAFEATELEKHLAGCRECEELFRASERVDQTLGKAMRQVEVPDRLRTHLLTRLQAERNDWHRQRLAHVLRGLAAAGVLLLIGWGVWWWRPSLPPVDLNVVWSEANEITREPASKATVEATFARLGRTVRAPADLNYSCLASCGLAEFQGQPTPQLLFFQRHDDVIKAQAFVYILSSSYFDLKSLAHPDLPPHTGYRYKVAVSYRPGDSYAYVFVFTGDSFSWLKSASEPS